MKKGYWVLALLVIVILLMLCWLVECQPKPPNPTPTPTKTKPSPTATYTPTKEITPTPTDTPEPTFTPTVTEEPTKTPKPTEFVLYVHTGYENGWLHFRPGPSKIFIPKWFLEVGALSENTEVGFLDCPPVTYPWVYVKYQKYLGYVYGEYLNVNPCSK